MFGMCCSKTSDTYLFFLFFSRIFRYALSLLFHLTLCANAENQCECRCWHVQPDREFTFATTLAFTPFHTLHIITRLAFTNQHSHNCLADEGFHLQTVEIFCQFKQIQKESSDKLLCMWMRKMLQSLQSLQFRLIYSVRTMRNINLLTDGTYLGI